MPREFVAIPTDYARQMYGVMRYLAVLAYPESVPKRQRFTWAYEKLLIDDALDRGASRNPEWQATRSRLPIQQMNNTLNGGYRRLVRRLMAAEILRLVMVGDHIIPLMKAGFEKILGGRVNLEIKMDGRSLPANPSLNHLADRIARHRKAGKYGSSDVESGETGHDVERRIWRESRPVLHLAWPLLFRWAECASRPGRSELWDLVRQPAWIVTAPQTAEAMRRVITETEEFRRLGIQDEMTIQLTAELT